MKRLVGYRIIQAFVFVNVGFQSILVLLIVFNELIYAGKTMSDTETVSSLAESIFNHMVYSGTIYILFFCIICIFMGLSAESSNRTEIAKIKQAQKISMSEEIKKLHKLLDEIPAEELVNNDTEDTVAEIYKTLSLVRIKVDLANEANRKQKKQLAKQQENNSINT